MFLLFSRRGLVGCLILIVFFLPGALRLSVAVARHERSPGMVEEVGGGTVVADTAFPEFSPYCGQDRSFCSREIAPNFNAGEKLVWKVTYMGLTAGYLRGTVQKDELGGREVFKLVLRAESSGSMSWMYDVQDRLVSFMDVRGLFSWGYDYFQEHNEEKDVEKVRYYQERGFFVHNGDKRGDLPAYTQDALSAVYYLRTQTIEVNDEYSFPVQVDEDTGRLVLTVKKKETIATYDGWKKAYQVEASLHSRTEDADVAEKVKSINIWLSADDRKVPYRIDVAAYFGSLYAYLQEYNPGGG